MKTTITVADLEAAQTALRELENAAVADLRNPSFELFLDPRYEREFKRGFAAWGAEHDRRLSELRKTPSHRAAASLVAALEIELARAAQVAELRARGIPGKDVARIVDGLLDDTEALRAARTYETNPEIRMLLLIGPPGTGKTTSAAWLCRRRGRFITAPNMARMSAYGDDGTVTLTRGDMLVIDDVGSEFSDSKGMFASMLDTAINERYADGSNRTVITSNLTLKQWEQRYGIRALDRLRECGQVVALRGPSLREGGCA